MGLRTSYFAALGALSQRERVLRNHRCSGCPQEEQRICQYVVGVSHCETVRNVAHGLRRRQAGAMCETSLLDMLDLRYTFPRIHRFAELAKVPGS